MISSSLSAIVTTMRNPGADVITQALSYATTLGLTYIPREKSSLTALRTSNQVEFILVVKQQQLVIGTSGQPLFFHPNMSQVRMKRLRAGGSDNMLEAMALLPGMRVLDCTLGFAADAIISAYGAGVSGEIIGLESNPLIALLVHEGLHQYPASNPDLLQAMRKIQVINQHYLTYLQQQPDNSFDVIYFDPMFRHPLTDSVNLNPLRRLANTDAVSLTAIQEAIRVARHRVVLKENSRSLEFDRLGFTTICGGKYAPVHYGVIEL